MKLIYRGAEQWYKNTVTAGMRSTLLLVISKGWLLGLCLKTFICTSSSSRNRSKRNWWVSKENLVYYPPAEVINSIRLWKTCGACGSEHSNIQLNKFFNHLWYFLTLPLQILDKYLSSEILKRVSINLIVYFEFPTNKLYSALSFEKKLIYLILAYNGYTKQRSWFKMQSRYLYKNVLNKWLQKICDITLLLNLKFWVQIVNV